MNGNLVRCVFHLLQQPYLLDRCGNNAVHYMFDTFAEDYQMQLLFDMPEYQEELQLDRIVEGQENLQMVNDILVGIFMTILESTSC